MKLHELKRMVKEEFDKFISEEEETDDVDISVDEPEEGGEEGDEDILQQIYNILKSHFEGEGEEEEMEDMGDIEGGDEDGDIDGEEAEGDDLEELANHGIGKSATKSSGANAGYKAVKERKGALQERFQKLANIIK